MSLAEARERAQALLLEVARGGVPASEKQVEKGAVTFEELASEYVVRYALREKRSGWRDEVMIKKELLPHWGHRKAHEIKRKDVIKLLDALADVAKNGLSHRVPLTEPVLALLAEQRKRSGDGVWAFPSPTRKGKHVENIQKAAGRVQQASGVDFDMHDLRRTSASNMTRNGVHRFDVSKILNHVEPGVTGVYDRHSYDPEKRRGLEVWANVLLAILADGQVEAMASPKPQVTAS